jgi:hypothetical protein
MALTSNIVRPYVGSGKTNEEIHTELSALTVTYIPIADFENFLDFEGLAKRNPITGTWEGVLITTLQAGGPLGDGLAELFSHINKPRSKQINTQEVEWAVKAESLLNGLVQAMVITQEQHQAFHDLGGGYRHPGIVVQDVVDAFIQMDTEDAEKEQAEAEAAAEAAKREQVNLFWARFNAKYNEYILPAINSGATIYDAEMVSALQDVTNNWNA